MTKVMSLEAHAMLRWVGKLAANRDATPENAFEEEFFAAGERDEQEAQKLAVELLATVHDQNASDYVATRALCLALAVKFAGVGMPRKLAEWQAGEFLTTILDVWERHNAAE
jgi:hypothetical protein